MRRPFRFRREPARNGLNASKTCPLTASLVALVAVGTGNHP